MRREEGEWVITMPVNDLRTDDVENLLDVLVSINDKEMNLNCTIDDEDPAAKAIYTFRMKFEPAK